MDPHGHGSLQHRRIIQTSICSSQKPGQKPGFFSASMNAAGSPARTGKGQGNGLFCAVGRKPRKISHTICVEVVGFVIQMIWGVVRFVAIQNIPNQKCHVNGEDDEPCDEHGCAHDCVVLRCRMAMEKRRIVPAQCAEYKASSV